MAAGRGLSYSGLADWAPTILEDTHMQAWKTPQAKEIMLAPEINSYISAEL
jgi:hypothetical protein